MIHFQSFLISAPGMSIPAVDAGLPALGGREKRPALDARLQIDVGRCRCLGPLPASVLAIPLRVRDCGQIPVLAILHELSVPPY